MRLHLWLAALGCSALLGVTPALAADPAQQADPPAAQAEQQPSEQVEHREVEQQQVREGTTTTTQTEAQSETQSQAAHDEQADEQRTDMVRSSELVGLTVRNSENKELGHIEDLMVDTRDGKIRYAALSFGGFLGLGDKLFAVPWQSMEVKHNPEEDERFVLFNIDEEKLKNAPGFDQESWPESGNQEFQQQVDSFYLGERTETQQRR